MRCLFPIYSRSILVVLVWLFAISAAAQSDWQSWNGVSLNASLHKKVEVGAAHTRAYDLSGGFTPQFHQTQLQLNYQLNKQWEFQTGVQFISPDSSDTRSRIYIRAAHSLRAGRNFRWTNSIRVETNSANENRFRQRFILTTRLGLRKRLDFLRLAPSVAYSLFYNIGGSPIRYYDAGSQLIARQSPDGFHRSRVTVNLNTKLTSYLSVNLYYMRQQEFNFLVPDNRKMNVYDPVRKRILRPFNNYQVLGLRLQLDLDPLIRK